MQGCNPSAPVTSDAGWQVPGLVRPGRVFLFHSKDSPSFPRLFPGPAAAEQEKRKIHPINPRRSRHYFPLKPHDAAFRIADAKDFTFAPFCSGVRRRSINSFPSFLRALGALEFFPSLSNSFPKGLDIWRLPFVSELVLPFLAESVLPFLAELSKKRY